MREQNEGWSAEERIAEVKHLAKKLSQENAEDELLELAMQMHRLLGEFLRDRLRPKTN
jgi:hypothetical protein